MRILGTYAREQTLRSVLTSYISLLVLASQNLGIKWHLLFMGFV